MTGSLRRFTDHKPHGRPVSAIDAAEAGRTQYPAMRRDPRDEERALKSGHHSRKIGKTVQKGRWKGMPIYTLTLEERATCPRGCERWEDCYGNKMHWSRRLAHGPSLESKLVAEVSVLARKHPRGFVVRLHVLGDFYSTAYVQLWARLLDRYSALNVFGYTAWLPGTAIGDELRDLITHHWDRFAVRFSIRVKTRMLDPVAHTYRVAPDETPRQVDGAIVCPAQTGQTECCATCALCWATKKPIVFLVH